MNKVVEVERRVPFPVEQVFGAWLEPDTFPRWFLPDPGVTLGAVALEPRVGGGFLIEMVVHGDTLPHRGEYTRIVPNRELAFTWRSPMTGDEVSLVEVRFEPQGTHTMMTVRHQGLPAADSRQAHATGWTHILGALERFLHAKA